MCKGRKEEEEEEQQSHGGFRQPETPKEVVSAHTGGQGRVFCELCKSHASLYCQADDAFLCRKCDEWVHGANFLAQRHIRCLLCGSCQGLTQRYLVGASTEVVLPTMVSLGGRSYSQCNSENIDEECSSTLKMPFLFL